MPAKVQLAAIPLALVAYPMEIPWEGIYPWIHADQQIHAAEDPVMSRGPLLHIMPTTVRLVLLIYSTASTVLTIKIEVG